MGAHACRWAKWKQKMQDDSETRNWMAANTKPCPKCGKPVEKNGGCNLVVCQCRQVHLKLSCVGQELCTAESAGLMHRAPGEE